MLSGYGPFLVGWCGRGVVVRRRSDTSYPCKTFFSLVVHAWTAGWMRWPLTKTHHYTTPQERIPSNVFSLKRWKIINLIVMLQLNWQIRHSAGGKIRSTYELSYSWWSLQRSSVMTEKQQQQHHHHQIPFSAAIKTKLTADCVTKSPMIEIPSSHRFWLWPLPSRFARCTMGATHLASVAWACPVYWRAISTFLTRTMFT